MEIDQDQRPVGDRRDAGNDGPPELEDDRTRQNALERQCLEGHPTPLRQSERDDGILSRTTFSVDSCPFARSILWTTFRSWHEGGDCCSAQYLPLPKDQLAARGHQESVEIDP